MPELNKDADISSSRATKDLFAGEGEEEGIYLDIRKLRGISC